MFRCRVVASAAVVAVAANDPAIVVAVALAVGIPQRRSSSRLPFLGRRRLVGCHWYCSCRRRRHRYLGCYVPGTTL